MLKQKNIIIGKCIYCGISSVPLTDEHIIPYGLGGTMILKKASCEKCRDITSRCERNPIHDNWTEVRAALNFPSRKRKFNTEIFPLKVELKDGSKTTLNLTKEETLGLVQFLELAPPAFFAPYGYKYGSTVTGVRLIGFGSNAKDIAKKYNVKSFSRRVTSNGNDFERMIAKIAYCLVIAHWGLDCFDERYVLPAILNQKDDIGYWVGCDLEGKITPPIGKQPGGTIMKFFIFKSTSGKNSIVVKLKFFGDSDAPEYIVVVGSIKQDFKIIQ